MARAVAQLQPARILMPAALAGRVEGEVLRLDRALVHARHAGELHVRIAPARTQAVVAQGLKARRHGELQACARQSAQRLVHMRVKVHAQRAARVHRIAHARAAAGHAAQHIAQLHRHGGGALHHIAVRQLQPGRAQGRVCVIPAPARIGVQAGIGPVKAGQSAAEIAHARPLIGGQRAACAVKARRKVRAPHGQPVARILHAQGRAA